MPSDRARSTVRSLATLAALSVAILAGSAQAPSLRIVSSSPTGDLGQLADADQIRILVSRARDDGGRVRRWRRALEAMCAPELEGRSQAATVTVK